MRTLANIFLSSTTPEVWLEQNYFQVLLVFSARIFICWLFFSYLFLFILRCKFCLLWSWIITPANDAARYHQIFLIRKRVRHTEVQEYPLGQHPTITTRYGVQTNERQRILEIKFDSKAETVLWIGKLFQANICISNICNIYYCRCLNSHIFTGKPWGWTVSMVKTAIHTNPFRIYDENKLECIKTRLHHSCLKYARFLYFMKKRIQGNKHVCLCYIYSWQNVIGMRNFYHGRYFRKWLHSLKYINNRKSL